MAEDAHVNFDPFIGTPVQTTRLEAACKIIVDGTDVTNKLEPYLLSLHLLLGPGPYQCELEIDDRDGRLPIPRIGATVVVHLGWKNEGVTQVFKGNIVDVQHAFGRKQGGRRMFLFASGTFTAGKIKEPVHNHMGEGAPPGKTEGDKHSFMDAAKKFSKQAGVSIAMSPSLQGIMRDYWAIANESPMHWLQSMASEFGAIMSIKDGDKVEIVKFGETLAGENAMTINCTWGDNLIAWRVRPMVARSTWESVDQTYYDEAKGKWEKINKAMGNAAPWGDATAKFTLPAPAPNKQIAQQQADGQAHGSSEFSGEGRIVINGEPRAKPTQNAFVQGARPGVDGLYYIKMVEHIYSRNSGFITWLDVNPNLGAGTGQRVDFGPANRRENTVTVNPQTSPGPGIPLPGFPQPEVPVTPDPAEPKPFNLPGFPIAN